jgi:signal transduction histidine kinase
MRCIVAGLVTCGLRVLGALMMLQWYADAAVVEEPASLSRPEVLTNLSQLRRSAERKPSVRHPFRIEAEVYDADPTNGVLALCDSSGIEFLQLELRGRHIGPGARVLLEGKECGIVPKSFGLDVVPGLVVDNDGFHGMWAESGTAYLQAGLNPISVQWFNRMTEADLTVEYAGPGLPRQRVSSAVLLRADIDPKTGATNFVPGLDYQCVEGTWVRLPDFTKCRPTRAGVATNFDIKVRTRDEYVGLEFRGFLQVLRDGAYTFYTLSDDGSRLSVGEPSLEVQVLPNGPAPVSANAPSAATEGDSRCWATLEGTINYAGARRSGGEMTVRVGNDDIRIEVFAAGELAPTVPLNTRVRVSGLYQNVVTEHGLRVPGRLLIASWKAVRLAASSERSRGLDEREGEPTTPSGVAPAFGANAVPVLTTAADVKALSSDAAKQRLPVSIRGVVIAALPAFVSGAVVQDSTKGVYISLEELRTPEFVQPGDFYQVDGVTGPGLFAPVIVAHRITRLGAGLMPKPLHASREQLMNGSLDTQYAEIEGVVIAVHDQELVMLGDGGRITLDINDFQPEDLAHYTNALIRIRGCVFAVFDGRTHELDTRSLRVIGGSVQVLQQAPRDLFDAPQKTIGELLLYDAKAAPYRRLKVGGQVLYSRAGESFINDGTNGMRITTGTSEVFAAGDQVEAVGFLELGGPILGIKEAVVRRTGHASLIAPTRLPQDRLLTAGCAGAFVQTEALLMNQWRDGSEYVLELEAGFLMFRARMDSRGQSVTLPPSGSRLELSGVYLPQGNQAGDRSVNGFELLLHSPACIRVLATPPWWTLTRVLVLASFLAALLCAVLAWNSQLQRKVQERGRQLEAEIHNRKRAELEHAAEAERSRIARDLHDELGTGLTEMSLLASAGLGESASGIKGGDRFHAIAEKARALVSGLDVIVWAIDPKRNSLQSFADYVGGYAKELLSSSSIVCRLKIPIECDPFTLAGAVRHSLFLGVKEALNNVIRHSSATEVELQMVQLPERMQIVIADNGCGFDLKTVKRGHGLTNLRERLDALHGECRIESRPGNGTTITFIVPLHRDGS